MKLETVRELTLAMEALEGKDPSEAPEPFTTPARAALVAAAYALMFYEAELDKPRLVFLDPPAQA